MDLKVYCPACITPQKYCVPDLQLDRSLRDGDDLGSELNTDGGVMVELELFLEELQQHTAFANTCIGKSSTGVSNDDEFKQIGVIAHNYYIE